jgi:heterodisulfide reductase subunit A-like polyferredoxin
MKRNLIHPSAYGAVKSALPHADRSPSMKTGKTQGYVLTFCCINCGTHGVFAQYPSDGMESEERIRARIYQVSCNSCGWKGDACGLSAIRISHTTELKARAAGQGPGL